MTVYEEAEAVVDVLKHALARVRVAARQPRRVESLRLPTEAAEKVNAALGLGAIPGLKLTVTQGNALGMADVTFQFPEPVSEKTPAKGLKPEPSADRK